MSFIILGSLGTGLLRIWNDTYGNETFCKILNYQSTRIRLSNQIGFYKTFHTISILGLYLQSKFQFSNRKKLLWDLATSHRKKILRREYLWNTIDFKNDFPTTETPVTCGLWRGPPGNMVIECARTCYTGGPWSELFGCCCQGPWQEKITDDAASSILTFLR